MNPTLFDLWAQNPRISRSQFIRDSGNHPDAGRLWDIWSRIRPNSSNNNYTNNTSPTTSNLGLNPNDNSNFFSKSVNTIIGGVNTISSQFAGVIEDLYGSQLVQGTNGVNFDTVSKLINLVQDKGILSVDLLKGLTGELMNQFINQLKQEAELRTQINESTTLTGILSESLREDIIESSIAAQRYGYSMRDLGELYTGLVEQTGKFSMLNKKTFDEAAPIVRSFVGSFDALSKTISEFENVGIGANDTLKTIQEVGIRSISLGLSGRKVTEEVRKSLEKLNEFGFQNGIKGLETMIRKSLEFRMSMDSVFTIANKVMEPEGALELAANLQVLGGAIGDFGDPIKMMYDATNNVESLQESLIGAAQSLATYNTEQGRFEITGVNLRRAKAMADQLGISYNELAKGAIAAAERSSALTAMASTGLQMDDEDKEFILNLSRMEGGEMKIIIPESIAKQFNKPAEIALDKLDKQTYDALTEYRKRMEQMDAKDIAMEQLSQTERMARDINVIAAYYKVRAAQAFRGVTSAVGLQNLYNELTGAVRESAEGKINQPNFGFQNKVQNMTQGFIQDTFGIKTQQNVTQPSKNETSSVKPETNKQTQITKEDMTNAFYDALARFENIRKKDRTGLTVQNINSGSYFSNERIIGT